MGVTHAPFNLVPFMGAELLPSLGIHLTMGITQVSPIPDRTLRSELGITVPLALLNSHTGFKNDC